MSFLWDVTFSRILCGHGRESTKPSDGEGLVNWKVEMAFDRCGRGVVTTF